MIFTKFNSAICFESFLRIYKSKVNKNCSILILKIWIFGYIFFTNCSVHGLFNESSNESRILTQQQSTPKNAVEVPLSLKCWIVTSNCYSFHNVTYATNDHQPIPMLVFTVVNYIGEENDQDTSNTNFSARTGESSNSTRLAETFNNKKASKNECKSEDMQQYKNILDLIELFLCLVITICLELVPLIWQQFQRQQRTFSTYYSTRVQLHQQRNRETQLRREQLFDSFQRNFWRWLLTSSKNSFFMERESKHKLANTLLAINLPIQQKESIKNFPLETKHRKDTITFSIVAVRISACDLCIKSTATDLSSTTYSSTTRSKLTLPFDERYCKIATNCNVIIKRQKIKPTTIYSFRQKEKFKLKFEDTTAKQNSCFETERKNCCCAYYCSPCNRYCCCCCCCCCSDCCCICYHCWPCYVCDYFCCYCCCCNVCSSTSNLPCSKKCCYSYYQSPKKNQKTKNCFDKCSQKLREHSKESSKHNTIKIFKSLCQNICECISKYFLGLRFKKKQLYHYKQRRLQQHISKKNKNLCNIDNCSSNYHQLKANNVCKFFCNNRKRQRRRRRKRRRHHALNMQDCQNSNRINLAAVSNQEPVQYVQRVVQLHCVSNVLKSIINSFQNALKTITKLQKLKSKQKESKDDLKQTTTQLDCDSQLLIKIMRNPITSQHQTLRRIYCRGLRSRPNLAWLFIGLVWFESSRLVDCYIPRQKLFQNSATASTSASPPSPDSFPEQLQMLAKSKKCLSIEQLSNTKYQSQQRKQLQSTKTFVEQNRNYPKLYENTYWHSTLEDQNRPEYSISNDQIRLESIKSQILSKLGLAGRPNVSHPLPKEYIWDTIYRVDELGTMIKHFDFGEIDTRRTTSNTWGLMDNYGSKHTVQVRVHSNSTHEPHQSYKYSDKQTNSFSQQSISQDTRDNSQKKLRNRKNHYNNKNKLTYLSGITSGMEVPISLESNPSYSKGSSRHEAYQTFGINFNTNAIKDNTYPPYFQINGIKQQEDNEDYLNDSNTDDNFGKTEEIIAFAEEGQLYSRHRLVEFSTKTKDLIEGKLSVRKAEIHLKINYNKNKKRRTVEDNRNLKIWIFRMLETNVTNRVSDQRIHFCAAFDIDTRFLGWKKLDITETVQNWLMVQRTRKVLEKLRLLIDCTGCGDYYRLHLFDAEKEKDGKRLVDAPNENLYKNSNSVIKHDVVALWLQQQAETNSTLINGNHKATEKKLEEQQMEKQNLFRPFLVIRAEVHRSRRVRRRVVDCSGALRGQCCKESFYVSFKALGWDDWIIAPRGYFANYCRGECTGPFRTPDTFQTFHAHFIEEYRKMGLLNGMKPCCAPIKFSSMSLIYYGDEGIIKRDLPKMVVDECGCP